MSANDILDVLNVQRDSSDLPAKKKQKVSNDTAAVHRQTGLSRELYSLLGPNTPPANLSNATSSGTKSKFNLKPSPWTRHSFTAKSGDQKGAEFFHWVKGSKELIEQEPEKPYVFEKFNVRLDIPELPDEATFDKYMSELQQDEEDARVKEEERKKVAEQSTKSNNSDPKSESATSEKTDSQNEEKSEASAKEEKKSTHENKRPTADESKTAENSIPPRHNWTYEETVHLFDLCNAFELKWPLIFDRFKYPGLREEDLKDQFYRLSAKIYQSQPNASHALIESLMSFSRVKEIERKQYLEKLLKRTPAEIAEEESLVIEARRFELAAKKMLVERSQLLTLLDSPQVTQSTQQYQSSQGLANLYNNLMIIDKHQKKRQLQQQSRLASNSEPLPPPIPSAASSSYKRDRSFQTQLQQYLSNVLRQSQSVNGREPNAIQQLLMKRLTVKEEEAYGLHYHANERLTPGVMLRSTQRLAGTQQRQSVLRSVNALLQELDIPTGGGTTWRPVMPTRKTMAKYDELIRSVVVLLDVKRARDKLESEIKLIKSQRGIE
ncbi:SWR1-complex protein 4 [Meyerozyma sp. JA9]|nr:SWR1-complex protein 4 [Meyerozyma sp. JA9]